MTLVQKWLGTLTGRARAPDRDGGTRCPDAPPEARSAGRRYAWSVTPHDRRPRALVAAISLSILVAMALAVGACASPAVSFDPSGPCTADGSAEGAYPELEALIPSAYHDAAPERLDSGRNCTVENLGSLAAAGIKEVRFAGGTWTFGDPAVVIATFTAPGLTADLLADFYANSARDNGRTTVLAESSPTVGGRPGRRLDTQTGDRMQTVVVWPSADADRVDVVISHDLPEARIQEAIDTMASH